MKLGTNFFRSQTPSHMTLSQLVMVAVVVVTSAALLVVDNSGNSNSNANTDNAMNFVEVSTLSAMPFISADDSMTTNWFCPGVPSNDETISSSLVISNASEIDISATVTLLSNDPVSYTHLTLPTIYSV